MSNIIELKNNLKSENIKANKPLAENTPDKVVGKKQKMPPGKSSALVAAKILKKMETQFRK